MPQSLFNHKLIIGLNDLFHCNIINECKSTCISIVSGIPQKTRTVLVAICHCCLPDLSFSSIQTPAFPENGEMAKAVASQTAECS